MSFIVAIKSQKLRFPALDLF